MSLIRFKRRLASSSSSDFPPLKAGEPYYDIKGGKKLAYIIYCDESADTGIKYRDCFGG